jgi:hypothetical protein
MKTLSFYEQAGILIPGAVFLFGLLWLAPNSEHFGVTGAVTVGGLGLFLILAYALGHAIAAVGNILERVFWSAFGGMPTDWVTHDPPKLLTPEQIDQLLLRASERFDVAWPPLRGLPKARWSRLYGQLYRDVLANMPGRVETFNGNYGLNRGLASAAFALVPMALLVRPGANGVAIGSFIAVVGLVYLYRMYRFGVHFANEVFFGFLAPRAASVPLKADPSE